MRPFTLAVLCVVPAAAQIAAPSAGFVRDAGGEVRPVAGVSGAFTLPPGSGLQALWGAFSGRVGLWLTADKLVLTDASGQPADSYPVSGPGAAAAFSRSGASGVVWLAASGELLAFPGWQPRPVPAWNGSPVALSLNRGVLKAVIQQDGGLWLAESSLEDGAILAQRLLPAWEAPVLLLPDGTLLHSTDDAVVVSPPDGSDQRIETASRPGAIEAMGPGWAAIRCGGLVYALNLSTLELHRLPHSSGGVQ